MGVCSLLATGCDSEEPSPRHGVAEVRAAPTSTGPRISPNGDLESLEKAWRLHGDALVFEQLVTALDALDACSARLRAAALRAEKTGDNKALIGLARQLAESADSQPQDLEVRKCAALASETLAGMGSPREFAAESEAKATFALNKAPAEPASAALRVSRVERYGAQDSARVVVVLSEAATYQVGQLPGEPGRGPRLFVDIDGASYEGQKSYEIGGLVSQVRVGQQDTGTRVVLDLRERVYQHIFFLPEPFRLVIDVSKSPPRSPSLGQKGQRTVQRVVLDPGHGGHDPGAIGNSGLQEKDVALDVALRAAPLIARELGINTLLTRDADQFVPLDERVARANAFSADLFISIHCNASESADSHGVMTFVLDESRDALAQQVAARENEASAAAGSQLASAMRQILGPDTLLRSAHFAQLLQRASLASLSEVYPGLKDGGVRRAGFYVLAGAQMPAVLFEASFISNAEEERRLDSAQYRQKLADALVNAVRAYQAGL